MIKKGLTFTLTTLCIISNAHGFTATSNQAHELTILNYGQVAIAQRLELIRSATKSISIESFSFDVGPSTRLLLQNLEQKAKEGVKVQMDLDLVGSDRKMLSALQEILKEKNIELRIFNPKLLSGFRTHRKILVVDDEKAIVGGRNLQDQQYENRSDVRAIDREVMVTGEIVKDIKKSFDLVFNGKWPTENYQNRKKDKVFEEVKSWFIQNESDIKYQNKLNILLERDVPFSEHQMKGICTNISWVTSTNRDEYKDISEAIYNRIKDAKKSVQIESPYFIPSKTQKKLFKEILDKNIKFQFLTNGALSSNEFHISLANYDAVKFQKKGLNIRFFDGTTPFNRRSPDVDLWRLHSKTYLIDESFIISSFNIDRRSETINLEGALICDQSGELVDQLSFYMDRQFYGQNTSEDFFINYDKSKALFYIKRMLINPLKPIF